ncbi:peroxisomal biogenesis factor 11-domain-containing protein [Spinellus fusiger]|nr:peroxisomal biogenesis factor 11-domain-containing protein [Spinellus fusiger]
MALETPEKRTKKPTGAIVQSLLQDLDGRDKTIKIIQYFLKVLVHYHYFPSKQWSPITSQFSLTRKILRLGHAVEPIRDLSSSFSLFKTAYTINAILQDIADDIFCLYKLGLIHAKVGKRAEVVAYYCWFAAILVDVRKSIGSLHGLQSQKVKDKHQREHQQKVLIAKVSLSKLLLDGVFCACDIWQPSSANTIQIWAGLCSGSLSGYKLWHKFA